MVRSPRHHVVSMFKMCAYGQWEQENAAQVDPGAGLVRVRWLPGMQALG